MFLSGHRYRREECKTAVEKMLAQKGVTEMSTASFEVEQHGHKSTTTHVLENMSKRTCSFYG